MCALSSRKSLPSAGSKACPHRGHPPRFSSDSARQLLGTHSGEKRESDAPPAVHTPESSAWSAPAFGRCVLCESATVSPLSRLVRLGESRRTACPSPPVSRAPPPKKPAGLARGNLDAFRVFPTPTDSPAPVRERLATSTSPESPSIPAGSSAPPPTACRGGSGCRLPALAGPLPDGRSARISPFLGLPRSMGNAQGLGDSPTLRAVHAEPVLAARRPAAGPESSGGGQPRSSVIASALAAFGNFPRQRETHADRQRTPAQHAGSTMYRRLERERVQLLRDAFDGLIFLAPQEYRQLPCSSEEDSRPTSSSSSASSSPPSSCASAFSSSEGMSSARQRVLAVLPPHLTDYSMMDTDHDGFVWYIALEGAAGTLYEKEVFLVRFRFSPKYPIEAPEVTFVPPFLPVHPHVYSNGHICLSILYDSWSPALGVSSCGMSLLSMVSSCRQKQKPADDDAYCKVWGSKSPKNVKWVFHDDRI
ncbi:ubiquitin-conjugating enzyme subfamily protein [Toxoplasma gondii ME49]|uniref:Ubiquitin-conjugating enzyme subfamily protein n=7 Tax=Toxoplasma gondii TaxID=5811 RepID=A0A125YXC2_TOXGV|nr:ubiquitin-conjugating enzyme subfamily protein [Toxoplasma gondii ME49]EPT29409.1 ubiquitin-conjugating enzyme subfamily protein [Toxoplasma gondii ME49]ESS32263.1 ubiquitin-conjugating enzyme subfamily protein [Toxoplasma gondii VEG]PIM05166.1 ubiquitin-conjugating enzyme subfamily protein [Toxoplasma gondii COUG]RQX71192.1 ubiquitin-conjugating enzyme subfamily protein [Toxoplasma gondii CAST]|eukprot:XP_002365123.2 ubiquitin-conjugating enzyme subfamily protein [Toxoplasma gondii ME49]